MRTFLLLTASLLVIASSIPVSAGEPDPAGNGVVMMVHGHFEPWVEGPPPAAEAVATTVQDDRILLQTITYSADDDALPIAVEDPVLRIVAPDGETEVAANSDPSESSICQLETNLPGHEGPIEACAVFDLPADFFDGRNVVLFELLFTDANGDDQREVYNVVAHYMLHSWIESGGGTVDLQTVDETFTQPTPYIVQNLVDPAA